MLKACLMFLKTLHKRHYAALYIVTGFFIWPWATFILLSFLAPEDRSSMRVPMVYNAFFVSMILVGTTIGILLSLVRVFFLDADLQDRVAARRALKTSVGFGALFVVYMCCLDAGYVLDDASRKYALSFGAAWLIVFLLLVQMPVVAWLIASVRSLAELKKEGRITHDQGCQSDGLGAD